MKTLIASALIATTTATASIAGVCDTVEQIDIASSMKLTFMLNGVLVTAMTGNPVVGAVEGAVAAGIVGGILYAANGTCYVVENREDITESVTSTASDVYDVVTSYDYSEKKDELVAFAKDIDYKFWN